MFYVENPNVGKNHDSPQTVNYHYRKHYTMMECWGNDLNLPVLATGGGYNRGNDLLVSLPLSLSLYTRLLSSLLHQQEWQYTNEQHTEKICPRSYLY